MKKSLNPRPCQFMITSEEEIIINKRPQINKQIQNNMNEILNKMKRMRLSGMARAFQLTLEKHRKTNHLRPMKWWLTL